MSPPSEFASPLSIIITELNTDLEPKLDPDLELDPGCLQRWPSVGGSLLRLGLKGQSEA